MSFTKQMHIHFVGIGGIGMSGIAKVFHLQGYHVTGSDHSESETVYQLREMGVKVVIGHQSENVLGADVVVISSAVRKDNSEVVEAKKNRIPVIPRAEMLGELMRGKVGISVAGSHGKTTTTSMLGTVLSQAELDPTVVIGGQVKALGGNAKKGSGKIVLAEADESDGSFIHLPATFGIITNIDNDHLDFFKTEDAILKAFKEFVTRLPFYGLAIVCGDDEGVKKCIADFNKPFETYGFNESCDFIVRDLQMDSSKSDFTVYYKKKFIGKFTIQVPGKHNVLNAVAAIALSTKLNIETSKIQAALLNYQGVSRRFEIKWKNKQNTKMIIDDYAHHPTEIKATLQASKIFWPNGKIKCVFQPHRYSRTLFCESLFIDAFSFVDDIYITDIYPAGEDPIDGVSSKNLVEKISKNLKTNQTITYLPLTKYSAICELIPKLLSEFVEGDLMISMGAGSITKLPELMIPHLEKDDKVFDENTIQ